MNENQTVNWMVGSNHRMVTARGRTPITGTVICLYIGMGVDLKNSIALSIGTTGTGNE